jgi:transcriptional regulator with XRE-family HTH domain
MRLGAVHGVVTALQRSCHADGRNTGRSGAERRASGGPRWTAWQLSERQQISGRDTQLVADLGNAGSWQHIGTPPVENGGAGAAETLAQCGCSTSSVDQALNGKRLSGHTAQCRLFRRGLSTVYVGPADAAKIIAFQTVGMSNLKAIGRRVRDLRRAEGVGQEELAVIVGVSRSTIAGIETGGDRGGIETMIAIADHYKVPMDWLLGRRVPPGSPPVGKLINRPDQIAILDYWDSLSFEDQKAMVRTLRIPYPNEAA